MISGSVFARHDPLRGASHAIGEQAAAPAQAPHPRRSQVGGGGGRGHGGVRGCMLLLPLYGGRLPRARSVPVAGGAVPPDAPAQEATTDIETDQGWEMLLQGRGARAQDQTRDNGGGAVRDEGGVSAGDGGARGGDEEELLQHRLLEEPFPEGLN